MNRAQSVISNLKMLINEDLFFPTIMNLRPMLPSESNLYKAVNFPNSDQPCIGTFLNISWVAILDYFGLKIQAIDDPTQSYIIPYRASSCQELATELKNTLDTLVALTTVDQLFDDNFLPKHKFLPNPNAPTNGETQDELQQYGQNN